MVEQTRLRTLCHAAKASAPDEPTPASSLPENYSNVMNPPALKVQASEDGTHKVIDGFHRVKAAQAKGVEKLPCEIGINEMPDGGNSFHVGDLERHKT